MGKSVYKIAIKIEQPLKKENDKNSNYANGTVDAEKSDLSFLILSTQCI